MPDPLIDAAGTRHPPAGPDARIVSLVPSITELLLEMDLGAQVVGRTQYCIHPADQVSAIPSVGGTKKIRLDRLAALSPTHVIVNVDENPKAMAEEIAAMGPAVVVTHPLAPRDNLALYRLIGGLFGRQAAAARLESAFEDAYARLERAAGRLPARKVIYWIWRDPWMTVSRDTYVAALLDLVNWQTLCHDPDVRYPEVELAPDLLRTADLLLFATEPFAFTQADVDAFAQAHDCGGARLALIDGSYTQWYGSRAIAGLDYLADLARSLA
ncbi:MAG: helical backbone metal receptor [Alphaproteobacteria bacterium]|nr:helical backbone metal receptor [Alphaproteobacteria bacterium]